jgi:hypothetical protein
MLASTLTAPIIFDLKISSNCYLEKSAEKALEE